MKRSVVLVVLSLAVVLCVTTTASAATKANPVAVTVKTKPKTDKKKPYKFTISGAITLPSALCAPNSPSGKGAGACFTYTCAAGVSNPSYCSFADFSKICTGKVRVTIKRGSRTWGKKTATLKSNCTYKVKVTLKKKVKKKTLTYGTLKVTTRFLGNAVFNATNAKKKNIKAGKKKSS